MDKYPHSNNVSLLLTSYQEKKYTIVPRQKISANLFTKIMIFRADNALFVVLIALLGFAHGRDPPVEADQDATDRPLPEQRLMPFETAVKHIRCNLMAWNYDFGYKECPAGGKVKRIIGIHRQLTGSKDCIRGATYGSIQDKVWVRGGCAAVIIVLLDVPAKKIKLEGEMCGKSPAVGKFHGADHGECADGLYCGPEVSPSPHPGTCMRLIREGERYCPGLCTHELDPVCGTNGKQYPTSCYLSKAKCLEGPTSNLTVAYKGECKDKCGLSPNQCNLRDRCCPDGTCVPINIHCSVFPLNEILPTKNQDICKLPRQKGHRCYAAMPRVYFDQVSGKCKKFTYGGCGATENNFLTRNACEKKCGGSLLSGRPTETGTSFPLRTRG